MADAGLLAAMRRRGAVVVGRDGWTSAAHFGDPSREYEALHAGAAVVDMAWLDRRMVMGSDRVTFLQGMLSNDVAALAPGAGCQALLLNEQGRAVAELVVLAGADAFAFDGVDSSLAAAQAALERFIVADDVEIATSAEPQRTFALLGPHAPAVAERLGLPTPGADAYAHAPVTIPAGQVHVVRAPSPGAGGMLCRVPLAAADAWWERALEHGATAAGVDAFDVLRIESGVPWHGRDVTSETLALEARYEAAISFRKGCYLGQEVMERVTARGHVNRKLVGVEVTGGDVPAPETHLYAGERDVGWVTSAARSWRLGRIVALAYVRREHLEPGTTLALGAAGGSAATVRALPF